MGRAVEVAPTRRSAGVLLHPTSLPGPHGIGELGPEAFRFVEFLRQSGQKTWQILPLNPPDAGGSPYSSASAFAGSPLLVSTERLVREGLLERGSLGESRETGPVDYPAVAAEKTVRLRRAYANADPDGDRGFQEFREERGEWLGDYALFTALKERYGGKPWNLWGGGLSGREPGALVQARRELAGEIGFHEFVQYLFFRQWSEVRRAANAAGIEVFGDVPIFVSHDSADVWRDQRLFRLDASGRPAVVAGVPPDYFSETGQLWGNPLYDWDRMADEGYEW
ncbi:MAG: 4-alpha-glucanotransferase, partial [Rubrobacter sp.]|nr:4-alpha-glucanotransferase [Rubrobacter sp.]